MRFLYRPEHAVGQRVGLRRVGLSKSAGEVVMVGIMILAALAVVAVLYLVFHIVPVGGD
jgi:hypothetical protein